MHLHKFKELFFVQWWMYELLQIKYYGLNKEWINIDHLLK